jgi:hypothetical protein
LIGIIIDAARAVTCSNLPRIKESACSGMNCQVSLLNSSGADEGSSAYFMHSAGMYIY